MILLTAFVKIICFMLFCIISAFSVCLGKGGTGMKTYYVFTAILLWGVMLCV